MKNLYESLLDDEDILMQDLDDTVIKDWVTKHAKGDYKCKYTKFGIELTKGTMIIKGFDGDAFPAGLTFTKVKGNLHIDSCPNITTLGTLFTKYGSSIFDGSLYIENCPKLKDLSYLPPLICGSLNIFGNKSLKSLKGMPEFVHRVAYIAKNGKKFSKDDVLKYLDKDNLGRVDTLSESFEEAYEKMIMEAEQQINEALNEPHLLKLAGFLRKYGKEHNTSDSFARIFANRNIAWNKITSSDVETFVWPDIDKSVLTKCRNIISKRKDGFILLQNGNGDFKYIIFGGYKEAKAYYNLSKSNYWGLEEQYEKATELVNLCSQAKEITIVYCEDKELNTSDLIINRNKNKENIVYNTPEYYKKVARENIERYKKIVAKNKVFKIADKDKYNDKVQDAVMRALKAVTKINSNPDKYADDLYSMETLMSHIYGVEQWGKREAVGTDGLLKIYSRYTSSIARVYNQSTSWSSPSTELKLINKYEKEMDNLIRVIEFYLNKFEV